MSQINNFYYAFRADKAHDRQSAQDKVIRNVLYKLPYKDCRRFARHSLRQHIHSVDGMRKDGKINNVPDLFRKYSNQQL